MLLIDGMVFFLQDTDLIFHSLQVMAAATDSVDSWKFLSAKKITQKIRHFVFHCFLRFCYFCYMLTVVMLVITAKASDKCTLEANYSMLFISMYKNGKIIPIQFKYTNYTLILFNFNQNH